jgi:hypothetical protein
MGKKTKQIPVLRTSERGDFKRCPFLWETTWLRGLTSRRAPTWSWFGTAFHAGMETRYKPGTKRAPLAKSIDSALESMEGEIGMIYTAGGEVDDDEKVEAKELLIAMITGYYEHWGPESNWDIIHPEQSFQIDVMDPNDPDKLLAIYTGQWDIFAMDRNTKKKWLWDHKTRKSFLKDWSYLELNDQSGSYLWVAPEVLRMLGLLGKKENIEGIVFNYARKHLPDPRPLDADGLARNNPQKADYVAALEQVGLEVPARLPSLAVLEEMAQQAGLPKVLGQVSKVQPAPLFHREEVYRAPQERATMGRRVQAEVANMNAMRKGKLPIYKVPTEDCTRCKIFDYCLLHESDPAEAEELAKSTMMHRDPYAAHREALERNVVKISG